MDQRHGPARPWLRSTLPAARGQSIPLSPAHFKPWLIGRLGAQSLRMLARRRGYPQNSHLVGVYGFGLSETDYLLRMKAWLACAGDGDLLMCHPSLPWPARDPLREARNREYRVLSGERFSALLESAQLEIGPLRDRWASVAGDADG